MHPGAAETERVNSARYSVQAGTPDTITATSTPAAVIFEYQDASGLHVRKQFRLDPNSYVVEFTPTVMDGDQAVAWAEYGTPEELPDIHHRKEYDATAERLPDYRVTCILVERSHRGQGLAAIALRGAVELIAQAGGGLVEGYPHDTGGIRKKNSSFLYNGTRTMYER